MAITALPSSHFLERCRVAIGLVHSETGQNLGRAELDVPIIPRDRALKVGGQPVGVEVRT